MNIVLRLTEAAVEFLWWCDAMVGFAKSFSCPSQQLCWGCVTLCCCWGCDNWSIFGCCHTKKKPCPIKYYFLYCKNLNSQYGNISSCPFMSYQANKISPRPYSKGLNRVLLKDVPRSRVSQIKLDCPVVVPVYCVLLSYFHHNRDILSYWVTTGHGSVTS